MKITDIRLDNMEIQRKILIIPFVGPIIVSAMYVRSAYKTGGDTFKKTTVFSMWVALISVAFIGVSLLYSQFAYDLFRGNMYAIVFFSYVIRAMQMALMGIVAYKLNLKYNYGDKSNSKTDV